MGGIGQNAEGRGRKGGGVRVSHTHAHLPAVRTTSSSMTPLGSAPIGGEPAAAMFSRPSARIACLATSSALASAAPLLSRGPRCAHVQDGGACPTTGSQHSNKDG